MDGLVSPSLATERRRTAPVRAVCLCALVWWWVGAGVRADDYRDGCDSTRTSWTLEYDAHRVQVLGHRRASFEQYAGDAAEMVQILASAPDAEVRMHHPVPRCRVYAELSGSLWYRSNRPGAALALRVVLPLQIDPETGEPLVLAVLGDVYTSTHRWQELKVDTSDAAIERQLMVARRRLSSHLGGRDLNLRNMHVDRVDLLLPIVAGATEWMVDELRFGPLVRLEPSPSASGVETVHGEVRSAECPVRLEPNKLLVQGRPFFPRFLPYHGESLDTLRDLGVNVVWVERRDDQILIDALASRGMWAMAAPPGAPQEAGIVAASASADLTSLQTIPASTGSILFWTLGTRVPARELRTVQQWGELVRDADQTFDRPRPVMADVVGSEREFSRYIPMLGTSRHILHTTVGPLRYREFLSHRQKLALPDSFNWTWIQTEPAVPNVVTRHPAQHQPVVVEAEQIWMQAWAAVSAGHKAIGYWKEGSLEGDDLASRERRLAIALLNAQIDLLEPWLATGNVVDTIPVEVTTPGRSGTGQDKGLGRSGWSTLGLRAMTPARGRTEPASVEGGRSQVEAADIHSEFGRLIIPLWYEDGAQFQPGQSAAQDVRILVHGADKAHAWEVSTTSVEPLVPERVSGGLEIRLPMIDQFTFIIITGDTALADKLIQRMRAVRPRTARLWAELARTRLERVQSLHAELERLAPKVQDASYVLSEAERWLVRAESELKAEQFDATRIHSRWCLQLLRKLQRAHWEHAVARQTAPVSSPHTLCFQTLPDHWRMVAAVARSPKGPSDNLLRSGDFENLDAVLAAGWQPLAGPGSEVDERVAELHTDAAEGRYCLRLAAETRSPRNVSSLEGPLVSVTSAPVAVHGGDIVLATGRIRVEQAVSGGPDGLLVYDNVKGTVSALRFQEATSPGRWESFELIREISESRDFRLTFELLGDGDVRVDDVRVVALSRPEVSPSTPEEDPGARRRRNLLDFAAPLPRVPFWPQRQDAEEK